jgi:hypothetical protein
MEMSYLFEKVKEHGGMRILTTNLRANLDGSFARLNQFQLESPFPDKENRQRQKPRMGSNPYP